MISTIYYGESDIVVFWHIKLNSTAEKTHPQVTIDQQLRNVESITETRFSLKP